MTSVNINDNKITDLNQLNIRKKVEMRIKEIINDKQLKDDINVMNFSFDKIDTIQLFEILYKLERLLQLKKCEQSMNNVENTIIKNLVSLNLHVNSCILAENVTNLYDENHL